MTANNLTSLLGAGVGLTLGLTVGVGYFVSMWRSAELFASGERLPLAIALVAGRFGLILLLLSTIAIRGGAVPLLAAAIGIAVARVATMRRVKAMVL